jgi:hypothetical protein
MGLFDYFKRRRSRESAVPEGMSTGDEATATPMPSAPTAQPSAGPPGTAPDAMHQLMGLQTLMSQHEVNLTQQPMEVREAVANDLQARGINAQVGGALQITDPQQIHDVIQVLKDHGLLPANVTVN